MSNEIDRASRTWKCVLSFLATQRAEAARNLRLHGADPAGPRAKLDLLDALEELAGKPIPKDTPGPLEGSSIALDS